MIHKRKGAIAFLIGCSLFCILVFNDILHNMNIINTGFYASLGLFIFIFSQAYLLSVRFSNAFRESEVSREYAETQRQIADNAKLEIEKLSKAKDEFLSNLSHELKTPLSVVSAYSEMLTKGSDYPEKVKKYSGKILDGAQTLNNYVSDLILLTDIESNLQLQKSKTEILPILNKAAEQYKPLLESKDIQLEWNNSESIFCECDPILLEKAFSAILKNAIVYNKQGGKIYINVRKQKLKTINRTFHSLQIKVTDTGIGIVKELQEKVFEKFFRVDSTLTYEVSGVGVGLYIAKKIVELHGGSLALESEFDKETVVTINMPLQE